MPAEVLNLKNLIGSLKEKFDTLPPHGSFAIGLFQLVNEFEGKLTRERVSEGIAVAKVRGHVGGRPKIRKVKIEKPCVYMMKKFIRLLRLRNLLS